MTYADTAARSDVLPDAGAAPTPLTVADRCDRCGAQAYVRATLPATTGQAEGTALLFCGHHGNAHRAALLVTGASLHDETDKLLIARESGFGG